MPYQDKAIPRQSRYLERFEPDNFITLPYFYEKSVYAFTGLLP